MRFPVGLPNGRTPLEWALAAAATSFSWPVADNVRSISVLRRLESLPRPGYHDDRGPSWTTAMRVIIMPIPSAFVLDPRSVQGITANDLWAFPTLTWPPKVGPTPCTSEPRKRTTATSAFSSGCNNTRLQQYMGCGNALRARPSFYAGTYAESDIDRRCSYPCKDPVPTGCGCA